MIVTIQTIKHIYICKEKHGALSKYKLTNKVMTTKKIHKNGCQWQNKDD